MPLKWPEDYIGKIIQGDCLEVMRGMPDKCVDLCLTDFPYGIGEHYDRFEDSRGNLRKLIGVAVLEILRISKVALITCGVGNIWLYPEPDWTLCWYTPAGCGNGPWGHCNWQPVLAYGDCPHVKTRNKLGHFILPPGGDTIAYTGVSEKNGHPCPKPLDVWKRILLRGSIRKSDFIFDPLTGSGTTALAAMELGRDWCGVELSEKYCTIARKRIAAEQAQGKLF